MKARGFIIYPGKLTVVDSFRLGCIGRLDEACDASRSSGPPPTACCRNGCRQRRTAGRGPGRTRPAGRLTSLSQKRKPEMNAPLRPPVLANGRAYPWPKVPAIAICLDGCEPAYLDAAIAGA
jgi:hypothetical protein